MVILVVQVKHESTFTPATVENKHDYTMYSTKTYMTTYNIRLQKYARFYMRIAHNNLLQKCLLILVLNFQCFSSGL
jgi:hypothetical protein